MKKYIFKIALFALSMGALVSCDEETVTYGGHNFVTFDKVASTRLVAIEDKGDFATAVNLAFPLSTDLVVNLTVASTVAVEGVDYTVPAKSITIPAGETTVNFVITAINNNITNDSKIVEITIASVSDASVTVGTNDIGSPYKKLVLLNEDCPTRFTDLLGTFDAFDDEDGFLGTAVVDINDTGDCDVLRITGVVESVLGNETDTYIEVKLVPGSGSTAKTKGTLSSFQQLYCAECYQNSDNGFNETFLLTPSGNFNTLTGEITISGPFVTASGSISTTSTVILRRQE